MTAYLRDAQRAHDEALAAATAAKDAAARAYAERDETTAALTAARQSLAIARLFPEGPPLRVGDRVEARDGFAAGVVIGTRLAATVRGGRHHRPEDLVATVRGDDGSLYPLKVEARS